MTIFRLSKLLLSNIQQQRSVLNRNTQRAISGVRPQKKIVILGTGWAAVSLIKSLNPDQFEVSVVSPNNYFLFTPLLPSVTVGTVEGRSITEPIRKILLKRHKNYSTFYEAECTKVNVEENKVECSDSSDIVGDLQEFTLNYDYLVVAVGAQTFTYNIKGVEENAHYMKNVRHAQLIRKHIVDSFETAAIPGQSEEVMKRLLHFVVVGGGPSGVEFAAELRDWIRDDLKRVYSPDIIAKSQITLIDGLNMILNSYSEEISRYTEGKFKKERIDIVKNAFVSSLEANTIHYTDAITKESHSMPYGLCIWCAGIGPIDLTKQIQREIPEQNNRLGLITDHFMKIKNSRNMFALGDCSTAQFKKFSEYIDTLLDEAGINEDVEISDEQFKDIVDTGKKRYPHLSFQFKQMDASRGKVQIEKGDIFSRKELISHAIMVDSKQTNLPPTAQVAAQEGKYLGKLLNKHAEELVNNKTDGIAPFAYNHLGSFAYVGKSKAVVDLPVIGNLKGLATMWLWRGIYSNECISIRMRMLVLFDWSKAFIFGRDTSRI